jgi:HPt (histidine-containing phosphotransfer) domain-containing protein
MIVKHGDPKDPDIKAIMSHNGVQSILKEHTDLYDPTLMMGRVTKLKQQTLDLMVEAEEMAGSVRVAESKNKKLKDKKNSLVLKLNEIKAKLIQKSGSVHDIEMSAHDIFRMMGIFIDFIQEAEEAIKNEKDKESKELAKKMAKKTGYELKEYLSNFNAKFEEKLSQRKNPNLKPRADGTLPNSLRPNDKVLNEIDKLKEKLSSMESEMQRLLDLL